MKLIFCPKCSDVVRLFEMVRYCRCHECWGQYTDELNATISEGAIPIVFSNPTFRDALRNQPEEGWGYEFKAFIIPKKCPTIKYE